MDPDYLIQEFCRDLDEFIMRCDAYAERIAKLENAFYARAEANYNKALAECELNINIIRPSAEAREPDHFVFELAGGLPHDPVAVLLTFRYTTDGRVAIKTEAGFHVATIGLNQNVLSVQDATNKTQQLHISLP